MNGEVSPAALAANRRLMAMRERLAEGQSLAPNGRPQPESGATGEKKNASHSNLATPFTAQILLVERPHGDRPEGRTGAGEWGSGEDTDSLIDYVTRLRDLPAHLGWGDETLTRHLRQRRETRDARRLQNPSPGDALPIPPSPSLPTCPPPQQATDPLTHWPAAHSVKVYPDIALALLREERAAAGRVWLLLRHLDEAGRGAVAVDEARAALCRKGSPRRLCGWRRLRQLLAEGEGLFWTRDDRNRLWLHGPARVAAALGVTRLANRPVGVPVAALLGGIGDARANLYAAFHSGRSKEMTNDEWRMTNVERARHSSFATRHSSLGSPIARDTLAELSGVCPRSQTAYERRTGICSRSNIALGERVAASGDTGPQEQERAWRHGRALFRFKDYRGRQGRSGASYLAWRLPNAYGPGHGHQQRPKGRQKRINRQLADLFTKGMTGNGETTVERRFFPTAAGAVKNYESEITNEGSNARSSTRHSSFVTRYWPVGGAGRGGGVWAAVERGAVAQPFLTESQSAGDGRVPDARSCLIERDEQPGTVALRCHV